MDKRISTLEPQFHDVLICKKNDCRPFLEVLIEEPENISNQNLGILVGIFQIDDHSEDSSYVVNYLISIIKKEYFSRANRGPVENFEAALHKANLALAKLASHENIGWIGRINAICAVIEKNNLLLSQTGTASAFLLRKTVIAEITETPNETIDSNPLKTFQDVISGRIEKNDKLLFTTKEIFDIFSLEEIKKSALKFSRENFIQFLNTALVNELDQAATLVIDITEKTDEMIATPRAKKVEEMNVFSQAAFQKELSPKMREKERAKEEAAAKERQEIIQELKEDTKDFVDKKTGHIYIKEPRNFEPTNSEEKTSIDFSPIKEKFSDLVSLSARRLVGAKNKTKNTIFSLWKKSASKISQIEFKKVAPDTIRQDTKTEIPLTTKTEISLLEKIKTSYARLEIKKGSVLFWKTLKTGATLLENKSADGLVFLLRKPTQLTIKSVAFLKNKWHSARNASHSDASMRTYQAAKLAQKYDNAENKKRYPWENNIAPAENETEESLLKNERDTLTVLEKTVQLGQKIDAKKFLPDFSRLKKITQKFDQKQKISAFIALILLLVVPYFIVKWENKPKENPPISEEVPAIAIPLVNDRDVTRVEKLDAVYANENISRILKLNNKFFAQTDTEIVELESKKVNQIAPDFQSPELFFGMDDLNLIFLVKNNQTISLSPTSGKFQNNILTFPQNGKIVDAKTYLTYIYLLDANNNQIYRAPRAEGGFGEKTAWLKDTLDLSNAKALAINENIFVLDGQNILKLFRGKKLDFAIESTATPIAPDKLSAKNTGSNLYILDKTNARIIKLDNDGKILAQYYNAEIADASDFSVSEESNLVYLLDKDGVKSFRTSSAQ